MMLFASTYALFITMSRESDFDSALLPLSLT